MSSLNSTTKFGRQIGEGLRVQNPWERTTRKRTLEVLEMVEMPRPAENSPQALGIAAIVESKS